ncbi:UDP-2,3-diacylglucosamine diphosphatase LpxI domain-containing protein [Thermodesulfobacteriota bacterium]
MSVFSARFGFRFVQQPSGAQAIRTMREPGADALAIEAGRAVVFDRNEMIALANEAAISIVAKEMDE